MKTSIGLVMLVFMVAAACGGSDDVASDGGGEGWCELARTIDDASDELNFASGPDEIEESLTGLLELLDQARSRAPGEIRDSVTITADAFGELAGALDDVTYDFSNLDVQTLTLFDSPELSAADDVIEKYNADQCGILSGGAS
jgi:hypothetical protein